MGRRIARSLRRSLILASLLVGMLAGEAGAQAYQVGWWLKAYGSAQVVAEYNHMWAEGYDQWASYQGRAFDIWTDSYCQLHAVFPGNNQGTPLKLQFAAPYGSNAGCIPVGYSQFQGWTDGLGTYSGQLFWDWNRVRVYESYVFPRAGNNSRGTTLELY